eukprot:Gregarina_sp_Pseudo_9__5757@NODE_84_length_4448_cov_24_851667_g76_i0_p2_GENE_NODE_84_length_4448_cov_24_851667_g76_i0NODE_84_length_4448_cov_24_851667_g76_i0_p2_ORF_typecomplete_len168_score21_12CAF20/PF17052_5/0_018_NODE_84_length_4448_cov_24_851667_g76_i025633066
MNTHCVPHSVEEDGGGVISAVERCLPLPIADCSGEIIFFPMPARMKTCPFRASCGDAKDLRKIMRTRPSDPRNLLLDQTDHVATFTQIPLRVTHIDTHTHTHTHTHTNTHTYTRTHAYTHTDAPHVHTQARSSTAQDGFRQMVFPHTWFSTQSMYTLDTRFGQPSDV